MKKAYYLFFWSFLTSCYVSTPRKPPVDGEIRDTPQDIFEVEINSDIVPECITIPPVVKSVDIDTSGCSDIENPHAVINIQMVSPYCGQDASYDWSYDIEWLSETEISIHLQLVVCGKYLYTCSFGQPHTESISIPISPANYYTVTVSGINYNFACEECPWTLAFLHDIKPFDFRQYRLWGTNEDIHYIVYYVTGACGCSTFDPLIMTKSSDLDPNYFSGTLSAHICLEYCCWDCDCMDEGQSEQLIRNNDNFGSYELVFNGTRKDVRGLLISSIANPLSECVISPATIIGATPSKQQFLTSEPIEITVEIDFDTSSGQCCERHTDIAFDFSENQTENTIDIFSFKGICTDCNDDSCPEMEEKLLRISPNVLSPGDYQIRDSNSWIVLGNFHVTP